MKNKQPKKRDPYALIAKMHKGAGSHGHPKRSASKKACRGRINIYDFDLEDEDECTTSPSYSHSSR